MDNAAGQLARSLDRSLNARGDRRVFRVLLGLLAEGAPVPKAAVARALDVDEGDVASMLAEMPSIEFDDAGNIVGADDCTLFVECQECGDSYEVETDAFGDGCMTYWFEIMRRRREFALFALEFCRHGESPPTAVRAIAIAIYVPGRDCSSAEGLTRLMMQT